MTLNAGIDIGSVTTKCVIAREREIIGKAIMKTGIDSEKCAEKMVAEASKNAGIEIADIDRIISTGYGRRLFKKAHRIITEISAAGAGASVFANNKECLIIDVGGQDTKIVEINEKGTVMDFLMNDKCAAGTGRFLEIMAQVLETDLEGFSELAGHSNTPVTINSTCSVFAESEVISLLASSSKKEDIAAGLFNSIASRVASMARQFNPSYPETLFFGGGAKSEGLRKSIEFALERKVTVPEEPQFIVAFGAAIS